MTKIKDIMETSCDDCIHLDCEENNALCPICLKGHECASDGKETWKRKYEPDWEGYMVPWKDWEPCKDKNS